MVAEAENKAIFRRFYEDAWNHDDLVLVEELLAPDFINHELPAAITAPHRELYKQAVIENRRYFPDWALTVEDLIAEASESWPAGWDRGRMPPRGRITDFWKSDDTLAALQRLDAYEA